MNRCHWCFWMFGQFLAIGSLSIHFSLGQEVTSNSASKVDDHGRMASGRELFLREWLVNDPRSHGGDGLGPVFNDTSCVACHNQGGEGGGGAEAKNVQVISAVRNLTQEESQRIAQARHERRKQSRGEQAAEQEASRLAKKTAKREVDPARKALLEELKELHPGLAKTRSVVLHRFGTDGEYSAWRQKLLFGSPAGEGTELSTFGSSLSAFVNTQSFPVDERPPQELLIAMSSVSSTPTPQVFRGRPHFSDGRHKEKLPLFSVQMGQRNATALFGAGLIDSIPDEVLIDAAQKFHSGSPLVSGRVARLKDGKIGRFGWKGQKSTLYDFTITACAVELGLHVPDHPQSGVPHRPEYQSAGFDLSKDECLQMVAYLTGLPAPTRVRAEHESICETLREGERLFAKSGCRACHIPKLGEVAGIFSDLLLHDMGPQNGDTGSYDSFSPGSNGSDADDPLPELADDAGDNTDRHGLQTVPVQMVGALSQEWRTPPLWGVRDSAPYLHDGRVQTLEQAIAMHGGEGQPSAVRFFKLKPDERQKVLSFLRSLVAPNVVARAN